MTIKSEATSGGNSSGQNQPGSNSLKATLSNRFEEVRKRLGNQAGRDEESDEHSEEEESEEEESNNDSESDDSGESETKESKSNRSSDEDHEIPDSFRSELKQLLIDGNIKKLCKIAGVSEKLADVANGKFARIRRNAKELREEKQAFEVEKKETKEENTKLRNTINYVDKEFGNAITSIQEFNKGNFRAFAHSCSKIFKYKGMPCDFATLTRLVAGVEAATPEEKRRWEEHDRLEQEKTEKAKTEETSKKEENSVKNRTNAINKIRERISGHVLLKRKDGPALVYEEMLKHYDKANSRFNITSRKAADKVLERIQSEAAELGLSKKPSKKIKKKESFQGFQHKIPENNQKLDPIQKKLQDRIAESRAKFSRDMSLNGRR